MIFYDYLVSFSKNEISDFISIISADAYVVDCIYAHATKKASFHIYLSIVGTIHKMEVNV